MTEITELEYRKEIESLAQNVLEELQKYPDEELSEMVFHSVDSHQWIMYNSYNIEILRHSEPQEWLHLVDDSMGYREVLQAMAFDAMRTDLWAKIHELQDN